jgi:hypothetical protein
VSLMPVPRGTSTHGVQVADGQGWEAVIDAAMLFGAGKAVEKLMVIVQPE